MMHVATMVAIAPGNDWFETHDVEVDRSGRYL